MSATIRCTRCNRPLDPKKVISLELDQRIWLYHDFGGVPNNKSQGCFEFGPECADQARQAARAALEAKGLFPRSPELLAAAPALLAAAQVIALTPAIVAWLEANDPKALEQVRAAIAKVTA